MRKVYIVKENAYTIPKLSKLAEKVPQTTHFRTKVYLQIAWPVMASHSLTFHRKVYKYAQAKNLYNLNSSSL
jgi:hypothetical protein